MANSSTTLADHLKFRRWSSTVELQLLRFWEARDVKRGGDLIVLNTPLFRFVALMPTTINVHYLPTYRLPLLARCNQNFRLSDTSLLIRFSDSSRFDEYFWFCNHSELLGLANTNTQLPDIISELIPIKSSMRDPAQGKDRVMATIKIDTDVSVTLSMFDSQALAFHSRLDSFKGDPRVVVATSINPKIAGGRLFLNITYGNKYILTRRLMQERPTFTSWSPRTLITCQKLHHLEDHAKVEPVTIAELNELIVTAQTQVAQQSLVLLYSTVLDFCM